ncbi:Gfo/Idh/MocA family protein [Meiothermus hypogaeus]|uniref:Dehydrogenase n=2 Tax=Meiothermus hypogaeus TaxID=884155 RepID=A0A511R070_9DEIN|nr:Gfo/Idh/MocA family oxidoreductase [Meiothermus hypogaeus]RIH78852.1 1,5-anhydro-D-fructose reductase [Meiothermus hypogaeus]GEM83025.1 dehydrogenase [Meiothermus hypogaeus NBRC 106114]
MKVGIIGAGGIALSHYKGYVAGGAEVVALADINPAALEARQREWNIPQVFSDYRDLLKLKEIEAVSVCTPNALHYPVTLAAVRVGKHVLCEKPISLSIREARAMIRAAARAGVTLQINHHLRSNGAAFKAKQILDSGALGRVTFIRLRQAHDWGGSPQVRDSFGKKALAGGGTLLDNGCHMFDLARYFGGPVEEIFARVASLKFPIEVEDTAHASLRFTSGAIGEVEASWSATGWEEGFWIYGTEGALEYTNRLGKSVLRHSFRTSPGTTWAEPDVALYDFAGASNHTRHIDNFLAAIRGERPVICSGEDGLEAVRLVLAAYESARLNQPIRLSGFRGD